MYKVTIFGYNFPHKKSEDFVKILKQNDIHISAFIAADPVKLNLPKKFTKKIIQYTIFEPKKLCDLLNIPFYNLSHNSEELIKIIKNTKSNLGIIAGARILKPQIINSFKFGVINFHPGKIPEASGLDSLMWSIYKNIKPFVTTHFINEQIDSGKKFFKKK